MITVMSVDDHSLVRQGVVTFLSAQPDIQVVADCADPVEAIETVKNLVPDVVLMDLKLNADIDGVEATRCIKEVSPNTQVLVVTSYHQDEYIFPAIQAGALSYLLKDIEPDALADAIRKASRGQAVMSPKVAERILAEMKGAALDSPLARVQLSDREREVLKLIATGLSNAEISENLNIAIKTVRCHVSNILSKLHLRDRTQAAVIAWQQGMME
ncbi:DNA-binding response regulator [Alteromonas sediminis]|uniref:DNA-binding response regulator n=1 Tax=Alteromonas sediminis TaxID=2259342 RepID=A0A3N5XX98_9ALTE|nr:response regulator transcription factor [Alteromonas sediminis]RPJ65422.1 DNA-binding response regulator [Alteromonas sediminis]